MKSKVKFKKYLKWDTKWKYNILKVTDSARTVLHEKFIELSSVLEKKMISIKSFSFHIKKVGKQTIKL